MGELACSLASQGKALVNDYIPSSSSSDRVEEQPARRVKPALQPSFMDGLSFESSSSSDKKKYTSSSENS